MAGITTVSLSTMVTPAMRAELGRLRDEDRVSEGDVTRAALGIGLQVLAGMSPPLRRAEYGAARMGEPPVWRIRRRKR